MLFSKIVIDQEKQSKTKFIFLKSLVGLDFRLSDSEKNALLELCFSFIQFGTGSKHTLLLIFGCSAL